MGRIQRKYNERILVKVKNMKRLCIILLCGTMLMTACGIQDKDSNEESQNTELSAAEDKVEAPFVVSMESLMKANESVADDFEYTITEDGVCVNRYIGDSAVVVVPERIDNIEVVKISDQAFANIDSIQAIRIADTVVDMSGHGIFINCTNLKYLVFGEKVEEIGEQSISGCANLEEIRLYDSLKKIGTLGLYTASDKLKEIHVPESVLEMGEGALNDFSIIYVKSGSYAEEYMKSYSSALHEYVVE